MDLEDVASLTVQPTHEKHLESKYVYCNPVIFLLPVFYTFSKQDCLLHYQVLSLQQ